MSSTFSLELLDKRKKILGMKYRGHKLLLEYTFPRWREFGFDDLVLFLGRIHETFHFVPLSLLCSLSMKICNISVTLSKPLKLSSLFPSKSHCCLITSSHSSDFTHIASNLNFFLLLDPWANSLCSTILKIMGKWSERWEKKWITSAHGNRKILSCLAQFCPVYP